MLNKGICSRSRFNYVLFMQGMKEAAIGMPIDLPCRPQLQGSKVVLKLNMARAR